ncbi:complement C1q-like protein 2 [Chanos chanos]|uniref:Complement C1q-like protein 2 n=1 Tax=Chanos chanos TaxID=29144 RepID=A0A6J2VW79_CHACN|nr:complement C1q-like protein 2 [Chanos chanos]
MSEMAKQAVWFLAVLCIFASSGLTREEDVDAISQLSEQMSTILRKLQAKNEEQASEILALKERLNALETPRVAFAASLGTNGLMNTKAFKTLIYKDVLTNVGNAYNPKTGIFKAPVKGVYYIRFTANSPTTDTMSAVLYKGETVMLIVHEQPSGEGSDTASNGAPLLLEEGDELHMELWPNTQIWDNSNHHSTFSGFLLFRM